MENGYLIVKNAFSREQAAEFTKDLWVRLGLDPDDESTWDRERIHMPVLRREPVATFAPRVSAPRSPPAISVGPCLRTIPFPHTAVWPPLTIARLRAARCGRS